MNEYNYQRMLEELLELKESSLHEALTTHQVFEILEVTPSRILFLLPLPKDPSCHKTSSMTTR